jgi:O-antigen/teichoic acid export membrane protein
MDWLSTLILIAALTLSVLAWLRTVPKRRFVTFLFLLMPILVLSLRWAAYRENWLEWRFGFFASIGLAAIWWIVRGRKLPAPRDGTQRVWTKDDPFE